MHFRLFLRPSIKASLWSAGPFEEGAHGVSSPTPSVSEAAAPPPSLRALTEGSLEWCALCPPCLHGQ